MTQELNEVVKSYRKERILASANQLAPTRNKWIDLNSFFYQQDEKYMNFLVPNGLRVLDLGCGTGRLLASLKPNSGVGVDFSPAMIDEARRDYPDL